MSRGSASNDSRFAVCPILRVTLSFTISFKEFFPAAAISIIPALSSGRVKTVVKGDVVKVLTKNGVTINTSLGSNPLTGSTVMLTSWPGVTVELFIGSVIFIPGVWAKIISCKKIAAIIKSPTLPQKIIFLFK